MFVQDIRVHSGKHRHQGGLVIYIIQGEGYSIVDGERHDWEAGDLLLLPVKPGGVEHQHFNKDDAHPAKWIAFISAALFEFGASEMVQLENHPELYDGGVDWEGTLFNPDTPNLFTYLPVALREYPKWRATGDQAAHDAMIRAGFAPGSEILWDDHYGEYWDLTQRTYREEFDPGYDGDMQAGIPFCQSGTPDCDADYDWPKRPPAAHEAMRKVSVTGRIGKPMLTLHGTLDALLPIATDSDVYTRMIAAAGSGDLSRYYVIEHGNHVDGRYDAHKDQLRPIWPCWRNTPSATCMPRTAACSAMFA